MASYIHYRQNLRIHKRLNFTKDLRFPVSIPKFKACDWFKGVVWTTLIRLVNFMCTISFVCLIKNCDVIKNSNNWQKYEFLNRLPTLTTRPISLKFCMWGFYLQLDNLRH